MPAETRTVRHEIPTHLDVQDRVILGLSARQTMLLMVGLAATYAAWSHLSVLPYLPTGVSVAAATACLLLTAAAVLVRPHGRGAEDWTFVLLRYAALPKTAAWRRPGDRPGTGSIPADWVDVSAAPTRPSGYAVAQAGSRPVRDRNARESDR